MRGLSDVVTAADRKTLSSDGSPTRSRSRPSRAVFRSSGATCVMKRQLRTPEAARRAHHARAMVRRYRHGFEKLGVVDERPAIAGALLG